MERISDNTNAQFAANGKFIVRIILAIVALWGGSAFLIYMFIPVPAERGQFGDLFGAINALFSGLALAGISVAIILQSEELRQQRHEIEENRKELARTAAAQERTEATLQATMFAQAYKTAHDILQEERVVDAREYVFRNLNGKNFTQWGDHEKRTAKIVCRTYDVVGIMIAHKMLLDVIIVDSWGDSIVRSWNILEKLVNEERVSRKAPRLWDDFERLAKQAKEFST